MKYPLSQFHNQTLKSKTGKRLDDITSEKVLTGEISPEDIKISGDTLRLHGEIAKVHNKSAMAKNLSRAAELTEAEDAFILEVYDKLRPGRSTAKELLEYANVFEVKYKAYQTAKFIRDAVQVYKKRGLFPEGDCS